MPKGITYDESILLYQRECRSLCLNCIGKSEYFKFSPKKHTICVGKCEMCSKMKIIAREK